MAAVAQGEFPPAIFLMGPTASGKTGLAMRLCDELPCEIISVDSALVYRGMDIGTAKPSTAELIRYPHHLVDILDPAESYSAARFCADAKRLMEKITGEGKIPLLVGGTMLYYRALLNGMAELPEADPAIRAAIEARAKLSGWESIHHELAIVDPVAAARIHPNDPQRLQRALEVYEITGTSLTEWQAREKEGRQAFPYRVLQLAVAPDDRAELHRRIALRFDLMLQQGFVAEVERLKLRADLHPALPSLRSVGYRQVWHYLEGAYGEEEMREKAVAATRQLAKRQLTWLRSWPGLAWTPAGEESLHLVKERLLRGF